MADSASTKPAKKSGKILLPAVAWALGIFSLIASTFGTGYSSPPMFQSAWALTWALATCAIFAGLIEARKTAKFKTRLVCASAIVLSCLASAVALNYYQTNYHDYPVAALGPALVVLVVALAFCRLKSLSLGLAAFLAFFLYGAVLPPIGGARRTQTNGTLNVTADMTDGRKLIIQGPAQVDLSTIYDLNNIEVEGKAGQFIPVRSWPSRELPVDDPSNPLDVRMSFPAFVPSWVKSWDAKVTVPTWPNDSEVQLVVDTTHKGGTVSSGNEKGYSLAISKVTWTKEQDPNPPGPRLHLTIACKAPDVGGYQSDMLRVTDASGHALHLACNGWSGDHGDFEIYPIDKKTKQLRFDLYSQESRKRNRIVFDFPRLHS